MRVGNDTFRRYAVKTAKTTPFAVQALMSSRLAREFDKSFTVGPLTPRERPDDGVTEIASCSMVRWFGGGGVAGRRLACGLPQPGAACRAVSARRSKRGGRG